MSSIKKNHKKTRKYFTHIVTGKTLDKLISQLQLEVFQLTKVIRSLEKIKKTGKKG